MRNSVLEALTLAWDIALAPAAVASAPADSAVLIELRAELERLKFEQAARAADMQRLEARLAEIEAVFVQASHGARPAPDFPAATLRESAPRLHAGGDLRLRYESNTGDADARDWSRGVLRARLRAHYRVADQITVGAQLATGDRDDPNSTDVTLSNFADDLDFTLDQAYVRGQFGGLETWGGKCPLPFRRSDLVWDGDVSPQGLGAVHHVDLPNGAGLRLAGLYFLVDHSVAGSDSSMIGAQLGLELPVAESLSFDLAAAMYDYSLASVAGADSGGVRAQPGRQGIGRHRLQRRTVSRADPRAR